MEELGTERTVALAQGEKLKKNIDSATKVVFRQKGQLLQRESWTELWAIQGFPPLEGGDRQGMNPHYTTGSKLHWQSQQ